MKALFGADLGRSSLDDEYAFLSEAASPRAKEARTYVESLWAVAEPYLDADAGLKAQDSFHAVFWEMYLAASLISGGCALTPRRAKRHPSRGPDFQVGQGDVWVEATLALSGNGDDRVTAAPPGIAQDVPDTGITLRLLNAIASKREKHLGYVRDRVVGRDEPFVIAINGARIPSVHLEVTLPRIVRCLFGIGHEVVELDRHTMQAVGSFHEERSAVVKHSGASVSTDLFRSNTAEEVSAVLFGASDAWNRADPLGADLMLVHNPFARRPLGPRALPCRTEWRVEDGKLGVVPGSLSSRASSAK